MTPHSCPFCSPDPDRVFYRGRGVFAVWDAFPVAEGHALIIPTRHVGSWFDATAEEQAEILRTIPIVRGIIEAHHAPDGYNIGVNVGAAAGQTIDHLHVHVIPRYAGDVPNPTGGVRHVIPGKGNYLRRPGAAESRALAEDRAEGPEESRALAEDRAEVAGDSGAAANKRSEIAADDRPPAALEFAGESEARRTKEVSHLIRGGKADPLLEQLRIHLDDARSVDIAAAFTLASGVELIQAHLEEVLERGGRVRVLTGDYLGVTEPEALLRLLDLQGSFELRVYESGGTRASTPRPTSWPRGRGRGRPSWGARTSRGPRCRPAWSGTTG
jgi:diadenosine tetraphosphate (Ap4A) HIT family hydrolase